MKFKYMQIRTTFVVLIATIFLIAGCNGKKAVYPVQGKVLVDGAPAKGATVTFYPIENTKGGKAESSQGIVAADGSFQLTTYAHNDGAPAGQYNVTIVLMQREKGGDGMMDSLGDRYSSPVNSGLTAEVTSGSTSLKPFELSMPAEGSDKPAESTLSPD